MNTNNKPSAFPPAAWIVYGFLAAVIGAVLFLIGGNAIPVGGVAGLAIVWLLAVVLGIGGSVMIVIGIIAKAIEVARRSE